MDKNPHYGRCSIVGCNKPATVRNFSCLHGPWPIKPDLKPAYEAGVVLKICAGHYNEDLRLYPRDKKSSPILQSIPVASNNPNPPQYSLAYAEMHMTPTRKRSGSTESQPALVSSSRFASPLLSSTSQRPRSPPEFNDLDRATSPSHSSTVSDSGDEESHLETTILATAKAMGRAKAGDTSTWRSPQPAHEETHKRSRKMQQHARAIKRPRAGSLEFSELDDRTIKDKFVPNVTLTFNLSNEPCMKYSLGAVADRDYESEYWTSYRLRNEAIYVESDNARYELALDGAKSTESWLTSTKRIVVDTYRWSKVKNPHSLDNEAMTKVEIPLRDEHAYVLESGLEWREIEWGQSSVKIRGKEYKLKTIQFLKVHHRQ